ncbi:MAG: carbohydrate ABC transporter permease [Thermomicrobiales bacterium]
MKRREALWAYLFILPLLLGFLFFLAGPIIASLVISLTEWDLITSPQWVGLQNYRELITEDEVIGKAFFNTIYLMLGIPVGIALSLLLALSMNQRMRGVGLLRTIYFLPVISSVAAISVLWRWIFNPAFGPLNYLLNVLHLPTPLWLASEEWAKPSLIIMGVWGGLGFNMMLYLSGLQAIPRHLYEAAQIDGANLWQQFRHVAWPLLTPTTFFMVVTAVIGTFQAFAQIHLMTREAGATSVGGGPNWSTTTVIYHLWLHAFNYYQMGYASAIAWVLALVILVFTIGQFVLARRWVFYGG